MSLEHCIRKCVASCCPSCMHGCFPVLCLPDGVLVGITVLNYHVYIWHMHLVNKMNHSIKNYHTVLYMTVKPDLTNPFYIFHYKFSVLGSSQYLNILRTSFILTASSLADWCIQTHISYYTTKVMRLLLGYRASIILCTSCTESVFGWLFYNVKVYGNKTWRKNFFI